jgi:pullulanase
LSIFDKIVPGYFYRIADDGNYIAGSGCNNDVASERPMVRKFIVDSIKYWMKRYHIDGFRFDLMGLLDKQTMLEVYAAAKEINPSALIYGEGWNMPTGLTISERMIQANVQNTGVAAFNDGIRDNLKGDVFNPTSSGFVQGGPPMTGIKRLKLQIRGKDTGRDNTLINVATPNETVNYVSAHDDACLWDKLVMTTHADEETLIKLDLLANAIILTSQGIPFIHAGDDFGRT